MQYDRASLRHARECLDILLECFRLCSFLYLFALSTFRPQAFFKNMNLVKQSHFVTCFHHSKYRRYRRYRNVERANKYRFYGIPCGIFIQIDMFISFLHRLCLDIILECFRQSVCPIFYKQENVWISYLKALDNVYVPSFTSKRMFGYHTRML